MSPPRTIDSVVIGAGQAGLEMSRLLGAAGHEHVVLERRTTLGGGWQDRWDGFRLVSPNWTVSLPGMEYGGEEPDGFMPRDEIVDHFRRYATAVAAPVELDTAVTRLGARDGAPGFRITTDRGAIEARRVVIAIGAFHTPRIPEAAAGFAPGIRQLHSHHYRRPEELAEGGVLIVGSGQSGVQLAEELRDAGRAVVLSVGHCGRVPRRYRDRDIFWWLRQMATRGPEVGTPLPTADQLPSPRARFACNPHMSGHGGGHETNLRRMATEGIRLVGRFEGANGPIARFAPDLAANLEFADGFFAKQVQGDCDTFAERTGINLPVDKLDQFDHQPPEVPELDLAAEGIATVLWTSGYRPALDWIELPIFDEFGLPRTTSGISEVAGLSFIGLPWQHDMGSANLVGMARDAAHIAARW